MREADNLPPYYAVVKKSRSLNILDPSGPAWPVTGVLFIDVLYIHFVSCYLVYCSHTFTDAHVIYLHAVLHIPAFH